MGARVHFVTGKGGVGKSTFASLLAWQLAHRNEGPVLLLEPQGSGKCVEMLGGPCAQDVQKMCRLESHPHLWGEVLAPFPTFKEYFERLLALENTDIPAFRVPEGLRKKMISLVFDSRPVQAFVNVTPGIEPVVLLGKIHWEAVRGYEPRERKKWAHVVVDAPATGHGVAFFRSTAAMLDVFGGGLVHKQCKEILDYMRDPANATMYLVTTPEELPLQESLDLYDQMKGLGLTHWDFVINRSPPPDAPMDAPISGVTADWHRALAHEHEHLAEKAQLTEQYKVNIGARHDNPRFLQLPERWLSGSFEEIKPWAKLLEAFSL